MTEIAQSSEAAPGDHGDAEFIETAPEWPYATRKPRLVVFEAPGPEIAVSECQRLLPNVRLCLVGQDDLTPDRADSRPPVPVYFCPGEQELRESASQLLRTQFFPLAASGEPYIVAFPFSESVFTAGSIGRSDAEPLDLEDIRSVLIEDAVTSSWQMLDATLSLRGLTPIEVRLAEALESLDIDFEEQAAWDRYSFDFLIEGDGLVLDVEADGAAFHDSDRDRARDRRLNEAGVIVLRFSGSEIWADADACARRVAECLRAGAAVAPRSAPLESLDASQQEAVTRTAGAARVLAPAGSGKTRVLVNRAVHLINSGVEQRRILVLAFNKKAAEQMESRFGDLNVGVSRRLFDATDEGVRCLTFNAFGSRYQNEILQLQFGLETDLGIWRDLMGRAVATAGINIRGTRRGSDPLREFLKARQRTLTDFVPADELEVEIDYVGEERPRVIPYGPVDAEFEQLRLDRRIQSFGDQVATTVTDLLTSVENRERAQRAFAHVLVDEFQDLDGAQLALLDIVSRPWRDLFAVGDDDQLINGWKGAKPDNILGFHRRMPEEPYSRTHILSTNYRSSRLVVDTSNRVIRHNKARVLKDTTAAAGAVLGEVRYFGAESAASRGEAMIEFLRRQKAQTGTWRSLAVLCRYKAQQAEVAQLLDQVSIPRTRLLTYRLFSEGNMQLLRAYIDACLNPSGISGETLASIANRPNRYVPHAVINEVRSAAEPSEVLRAYIDRRANAGEGFAVERLVDLRKAIATMNRRLREQEITPAELLREVVNVFGLDSYWKNARKPKGEADEANPLFLLDLVIAAAERVPTLDAFLSYWDSRVKAEQEETQADTLEREDAGDRVIISTLHASKGREYEAVVLWDYACDDVTEEERRVFYVGLTRAKHSVLVTVDPAHPVPLFVREAVGSSGDFVGDVAAAKARVAELSRELPELARQQERIRQLLAGTASPADVDAAHHSLRALPPFEGIAEVRQAEVSSHERYLKAKGEARASSEHLRQQEARLADSSSDLVKHEERGCERLRAIAAELIDKEQRRRELSDELAALDVEIEVRKRRWRPMRAETAAAKNKSATLDRLSTQLGQLEADEERVLAGARRMREELRLTVFALEQGFAAAVEAKAESEHAFKEAREDLRVRQAAVLGAADDKLTTKQSKVSEKIEAERMRLTGLEILTRFS